MSVRMAGVVLLLRVALDKTQSAVEHHGNTRIDDAVEDVVPVAARAENASVGQSLKLVGDGLRFHLNGPGQVRDTQFAFAHQGVKQAQPRVVGKDFEQPHQRVGLIQIDQRAVFQRVPLSGWPLVSTDVYRFHSDHTV